jgi:hypothetical protein
MNFDISQLLDQWDYHPGQVVVRKFIGKDGQEKLQLRVDLGLLQMNAHGRPDGKRPSGHPSLFEFFQSRLEQHRRAHDGEDEEFTLGPEECSRLQLEALQYHNRCICLLQLSDFASALRDAERNLALLDFVKRHAESDELAMGLQQFRPQVILNKVRAAASRHLQEDDFSVALRRIEEGIEEIREFLSAHGRAELIEHCPEVQALQHWHEEVGRKRPRTERERLEQDLNDAVEREDYEAAARVRDALRNLKPSE